MKALLQGGRPRVRWFGGIGRDVRYAVRSLCRSPGFTLVAIVTLAVGIGVNAAVFAVTNAVLFKEFPLVQRNDRVLYLSERSAILSLSLPDFEDWQTQAKSFQGMALVGNRVTILDAPDGSSRSYLTTEVTPNAFGLLGVKPILGRDFSRRDGEPGASPVVILRYRFWEQSFGRDPGIIGRTVKINGIPTTVIGVMPPGFSFPQGRNLWMPLVPTPELQNSDSRRFGFAFARLADGVSLRKARSMAHRRRCCV